MNSNKHKEDISLAKLKDEISVWNLKYPLDRWWREKHKIPFGSKKHKQQNAYDIRLEFEEDCLYKQAISQEDSSNKYVPGTGSYLKKRVVKAPTEEEIDDYFDSIDVSTIDESTDKTITIKRR